MSYIDFESEGIEYRLILSRHKSKRDEPIDGIDALVVETGLIPPENAESILYCKELFNYLSEIQERKIPLYSVDNKGRNSWLVYGAIFGHRFAYPVMVYLVSKLIGADNTTANLMALGTTCGETAFAVLPSFLGNGISKFFAKINSVLSFIRQSPIEELINALTAKKIKKGVVPHLIEKYPDRFQERNPRIGIIYGSAHSSIKECLENDLRTNISLGLHRHYGLKFILDRGTLRDFYEYKLNSWGRIDYQKLQVESI